MELTNRSIELKPVKLLDMNTKKVWFDKNKENKKTTKKFNKKQDKANSQTKKKHEIIYTKELVISELKKFGGTFVYFPAYKDEEITSEGYLLTAAEENSQFVYYVLDKDRNIQKVQATRTLEFRAIPSEFFVIKWLTENKNDDLYYAIKDYFKDMTLLTPVYFKLNKMNLDDKKRKK